MDPWEEQAVQLSKGWALRADAYDRTGAFPYDNFEELKGGGFLRLTIPKEYGGEGFSLSQFLRIQEILAQGDASTALGLGWHLGILMKLRDSGMWKEEQYRRLCMEVVREGAVINSIATEPATGSPSRGGQPHTRAIAIEGGWRIDGHKSWATLSPILTYFLITAAIDEDRIGEFLVHRDHPGLQIEECWDSLGMRATGSHDVSLKNIVVPDEALVYVKEKGKPEEQKDHGGWLLHIPATYLGIAAAARRVILQFASEYAPSSLGGPIGTLPTVREKIGVIELKMMTARTFLYAVARRWDEKAEERGKMEGELAACKVFVTNTAIEVVDLAMRIMGGHSILKKYPMERYYRDVRAGLHNPPMEDATLRMLAASALQQSMEGSGL